MHAKVIIYILYFGKLPDIFPAWWQSAKNNPDYHFHLITDQNHVKGEENIQVTVCSFEELREKIASLFSFPIVLDEAYKLCDYRPALGELFQEQHKTYDFWGYCDLDIVLGSLNHFLTEDVWEKYDRIFTTGHLSLYRNTAQMNRLFRDNGVYPEMNYEEAYQTDKPCYFDEFPGLELKTIRNQISSFFRKGIIANLPVFRANFLFEGKQIIAKWEQGELFALDKAGNRQELLYIHLCRRQMILQWDMKEEIRSMCIVPGTILCNETIPLQVLFRYRSGSILYPIKISWKRYKILRRYYTIPELFRKKRFRKKVSKYKRYLRSYEKK